MNDQRKNPGVYINELSGFQNSIPVVATAVPVFIGYTQQTELNGKALQNQAIGISSMEEYMAMFGGAYTPSYSLQVSPAGQTGDVVVNGSAYNVNPASTVFYLYNSLLLFYQNGGGYCYVISIGNYSAVPQLGDFMNALPAIKEQPAITLVLAPDALALGNVYYTFINAALEQCAELQNSMTLADVVGGNSSDMKLFLKQQAGGTDPVSTFRANVQASLMCYGASYFPWLNTTIVQQSSLGFLNLSGGFAPYAEQPGSMSAADYATMQDLLAQIKPGLTAQQVQQIHHGLWNVSPNYKNIMSVILDKVNCLPVTPAVAGAMNTVDTNSGVWVAPANVSLAAVTSPTLIVSDTIQDWMNVDPVTGKSVNAIRYFNNMGTVIWGARTLDGNSNDWRYINVRRTIIMIEQTIKMIMQQYVFSPNNGNTWMAVNASVTEFLAGFWQQGGLAGSKPADAFSVSIGDGTTMTAQDILNGYMVLMALVAVTHPAEFIVITCTQQMAGD
ncbi:MAG: phage tail sheath family protein [Bacteroidetes bacterium]|nr:phage tail sheath family protein [Bacteroidota bacterium]